MVEAVVILPAFMVVVLLAVQGAIWAYGGTLVQAAASQGDQAARSAGAPAYAGTQAAAAFLQGNAKQLVTSVVATSSIQSGDVVEVRVSANAESIIPWVHLPVTGIAAGPRQEFRQSA